jgi:colicin import membrane protein
VAASANPAPRLTLAERAHSSSEGQEGLYRWLVFSFIVHTAFIIALFVVPYVPAPKSATAPVYTVDLVGGEKIGGSGLRTETVATPAKEEPPKKAALEPPPPAPEKKIKVEKPEKLKVEKAEKVEKTKPVEKAVPAQDKVVLKETTKKSPAKETKESEATATKADEDSLDRVRERLMQAALERAKNRSEGAQKASKGGEVTSSSTGPGEGAAALGQGGRGGGVVNDAEFIAYHNRMLSMIRENWIWAGRNTNLKTTVRFSVRETGEIAGLKITQGSGDVSYDDSVVRAVRKSSPLPPPPENYRKDFMDVELVFRPKDLAG